MMGEYQREVLAKTPGLYQVPKLRNLKSGKIVHRQTDRQTDQHSDLYYPLVADKNEN